jgi:hypothetical protein
MQDQDLGSAAQIPGEPRNDGSLTERDQAMSQWSGGETNEERDMPESETAAQIPGETRNDGSVAECDKTMSQRSRGETNEEREIPRLGTAAPIPEESSNEIHLANRDQVTPPQSLAPSLRMIHLPLWSSRVPPRSLR